MSAPRSHSPSRVPCPVRAPVRSCHGGIPFVAGPRPPFRLRPGVVGWADTRDGPYSWLLSVSPARRNGARGLLLAQTASEPCLLGALRRRCFTALRFFCAFGPLPLLLPLLALSSPLLLLFSLLALGPPLLWHAFFTRFFALRTLHQWCLPSDLTPAHQR